MPISPGLTIGMPLLLPAMDAVPADPPVPAVAGCPPLPAAEPAAPAPASAPAPAPAPAPAALLGTLPPPTFTTAAPAVPAPVAGNCPFGGAVLRCGSSLPQLTTIISAPAISARPSPHCTPAIPTVKRPAHTRSGTG